MGLFRRTVSEEKCMGCGAVGDPVCANCEDNASESGQFDTDYLNNTQVGGIIIDMGLYRAMRDNLKADTRLGF